MLYLLAEEVVLIHESVIHPHELQGERLGNGVKDIVSRIETRLTYGLIPDVFALAACYGAFIAVAHAFYDANKRTAFACMDTILALNGIELIYPNEQESGDMIRNIVLHRMDENDLADWLRTLALNL